MDSSRSAVEALPASILPRKEEGRHLKDMAAYGYLANVARWQEDFETGEVEAESDDEADYKIGQELVALKYRMASDLPQIISVEKWPIDERRYHLNLASDRDDLEIEEVPA